MLARETLNQHLPAKNSKLKVTGCDHILWIHLIKWHLSSIIDLLKFSFLTMLSLDLIWLYIEWESLTQRWSTIQEDTISLSRINLLKGFLYLSLALIVLIISKKAKLYLLPFFPWRENNEFADSASVLKHQILLLPRSHPCGSPCKISWLNGN